MYEFLEYRVKDVMTREAITIEPQTRLGEARRLVGMIAREDVLRAVRCAAAGQSP